MINQFEEQFGKILAEDFESILRRGTNDLNELVNSNLVITGASGFIGKWLVLSWLHARQEFGGNGQLLLNARDLSAIPELCKSFKEGGKVRLLEGDIRELSIPKEFKPDYFIHAATPASAKLNEDNPVEMVSVIIDGQKRVLQEVARFPNAKMLFISSGAVYGNQPAEMQLIDETYTGGPSITDVKSAYHEAKRVAELLGNISAHKDGVHFITGRLFAFLAPFLPMRTHFAAGNFVLDALENRDILVNSDGQSVRSYQYGTDLCAFLWALLNRGKSGEAYNVGSDEAISISDLAFKVKAIVNPNIAITFKPSPANKDSNRYVPNISKVRTNFAMNNMYGVDEAITRTATWWENGNGRS